MKRFTLLLLMLLILCIPVLGRGTQIFGTLRTNNSSVGPNVTIRIQCDGGAYEGRTDAYGSYRVGLPRAKSCGLSVYYAGVWSTAFSVYPDDDPVRYDFDLMGPYNGNLSLARR